MSSNSLKIGCIISSDNETACFEADRNAESRVKVGDFVVVEEGERKLLAQVQRLRYEDISDLPHHYRTARPETLNEYREGYRLWGEVISLVEIGADARMRLPRSPIEPTKEVRFATEHEVKNLLQQVTANCTPITVGTIDQQNARIDFAIPIEKMIERHTAILGVTGSGKSNLVKRILYGLKLNEEQLMKRFTVLVFDVHEEYEVFERSGVPVFSLDKYSGLPRLTIPIAPLEADPNILSGILYPEGPASEVQRIFFDVLLGYAKENGLNVSEAMDQLYAQTFQTARGRTGRADPQIRFKNRTIPISFHTLEALKRRTDDLYSSIIFEHDGYPQWDRIQEMVDNEGGLAIIEFGKTSHSDRVKAVQVIASYIINSRRHVGRLDLEKRPFVWLMIEEAHNFLSQEAPTLPVLRMISQEGRKFRMGLGVISQTPRRMDDVTLSQCNSLIALKVINPKDQDTIRDSCAMVEQRMAQHLPRLNVGQAYFNLADSLAPVLVQIERFTEEDLARAQPETGERAPRTQELAKDY